MPSILQFSGKSKTFVSHNRDEQWFPGWFVRFEAIFVRQTTRYSGDMYFCSLPIRSKEARIFFKELVAERTAIRLIIWSSLGVVFFRAPLLFKSLKVPCCSKFTIAVCTAVLLKPNFSLIWRSVHQSFFKIMIWALLVSETDDFSPFYKSKTIGYQLA